MSILINGRDLPCVISYETTLRARNHRREYTADGCLHIENLNLKYSLSVHMGRMTPFERSSLLGIQGESFAEVSFYSPIEDIQVSRGFFVESLTETITDQFANTGEMTLTMEER